MESKPENNKILIILGPTSSGKTSLAVNLANCFNAEIISADSRQIYKYMDIGTGKIPVSLNKAELEKNQDCWKISGVKIWGYDLVEPGEYFSAYDFVQYAQNIISKTHFEGKNLIITGGTGFYIDALTGKTPLSKSQPDLNLREELEKLTIEELQLKLKSINSDVFNKIDKKNPRRLMRAIEKSLNPSEEWTNPKNFEYFVLGLNAPREYLYKKADFWTDVVWKNGLTEETQKLIDRGYKETSQLKGIVYKTTVAFLGKNISEQEAVQRIKFDLHAYIRRQQTWFKRHKEIEWLDVSKENFSKTAANTVKSKLEWIETSSYL